jgi:hypothetical protein
MLDKHLIHPLIRGEDPHRRWAELSLNLQSSPACLAGVANAHDYRPGFKAMAIVLPRLNDSFVTDSRLSFR